MAMIELTTLRVRYRGGPVLFDRLSLSINSRSGGAGTVVAIMGASACGKTTLLRTILKLPNPIVEAGEVRISPAGLMLGYVPQSPVVFGHLTPKENARYFANIRSTRCLFDPRCFDEAVETLDLADVLNRPSVSALSGGERQRLALLRAVSTRPQVLLLDEPCAGLDAATRDRFLAMLRQIVEAGTTLVLYVTHHAQEARIIADRVLFLERRSFDSPATVVCNSLEEFEVNPPTLSAAHSFQSPYNALPCSIRDGKEIVVRDIYLGETKLVAGDEPVFVGIPPNSIRASDEGLPVGKFTKTGTFSLFEVDFGGRPLTVYGPPFREQPKHITVSGSCALFDQGGIRVGSVECSGSNEGVFGT